MKCASCGAENELTALTCGACGDLIEREGDSTMSLPPVDVDVDEAFVDATAHQDPSLVVTKGPFVGQRFRMSKGEVTLGRDPGSDVFLDDITVSRRHARIVLTDEGPVVEDVGSLNGTYVNNQLIEKSPLAGGDELQIGKYKLVFVPPRRYRDAD